MRPAAELSSAGEPPPCTTHACHNPWWPYSNSRDFVANTTIIVIFLLSAIAFSLAINAAIRCFLRSRRPHPTPNTTGVAAAAAPPPQPKPSLGTSSASEAEGVGMVVFSAGMEVAGAEPECSICLSEFVEGERIRVLESCNHGFHSHCIQEWLSAQSSCPTCRATCVVPSSASSTECRRGSALLLSTL